MAAAVESVWHVSLVSEENTSALRKLESVTAAEVGDCLIVVSEATA